MLPGAYQVNDRERPIGADATARRARTARDRRRVLQFQPDLQDQSRPCSTRGWRYWRPSPIRCSGCWRATTTIPRSPTCGARRKRGASRRHGSSSRRTRPNPEHLARYRRADLFLDTWPYNAHTTASDALWAGCPVLTHRGSTFAGRVAASLVSAAGLPELVQPSVEAYIAKAIELARDPAERARVARASRRTGPGESAVQHRAFDARARDRLRGDGQTVQGPGAPFVSHRSGAVRARLGGCRRVHAPRVAKCGATTSRLPQGDTRWPRRTARRSRTRPRPCRTAKRDTRQAAGTPRARRPCTSDGIDSASATAAMPHRAATKGLRQAGAATGAGNAAIVAAVKPSSAM